MNKIIERLIYTNVMGGERRKMVEQLKNFYENDELSLHELFLADDEGAFEGEEYNYIVGESDELSENAESTYVHKVGIGSTGSRTWEIRKTMIKDGAQWRNVKLIGM